MTAFDWFWLAGLACWLLTGAYEAYRMHKIMKSLAARVEEQEKEP